MCPQEPRRCVGSHTHVSQCCHTCHPLLAVICSHSTPPGCMATPMAPLCVSPPGEMETRGDGATGSPHVQPSPIVHQPTPGHHGAPLPMQLALAILNAPQLSSMHPGCPQCTPAVLNAPWLSSMHPSCPQCTPAVLNAPRLSSMHPGCPQCTPAVLNTPRLSSTHPGLPQCTAAILNVPRLPSMHPSCPQCTPVCPGLP